MPPESNTLKRKARDANDEIPTGSAGIKKKLRDTERALRRPTLSAKAKLELERKLKALKFHASEKMIDDVERNNAKNYHMVRHFERNKNSRKIKRAEKELNEAKSDKEKKRAKKTLNELNIDRNYINHYPMIERYVSLYPSNYSNEGSSAAARKEIRDRIAAAMKDDEIDSEVLRKHYRDKYRDNLVKTGKVPPIEASADDLMALQVSQTEKDQPKKKAKKEKFSKSNKKTAEEKGDVGQDDFFISQGVSDEE